MKAPADYHWEEAGPDGGLRPGGPPLDLVKQRHAPDGSCFLSIRFPGETHLLAPGALLDGVSTDPTPPEHFHLTLLVAEQCSDDQLSLFLNNLSPIMPFSLEVTGLRLIDGEDSKVLVWSVDPGPALSRMQFELYNAVVNEDMVISPYSEPAAWLPHITLAYILDNSLRSEDLPQIEPFRLMVNSFTIGRSYDDYFEINLPRGMSSNMLIERHLGGHSGQQGTPGGGSQPGFTHEGASEEAKHDFQGRPIGPDRTIRGGNLTKEEVDIFDLASQSPLGRFDAAGVNSDALATFKKEGLVKLLVRQLKKSPFVYELTREGNEIQTQLLRVRERISSQPVERDRNGMEITITLSDLSKIVHGGQIVKGVLRRMVGIEDGPFVIERAGSLYAPKPAFGGPGEGSRGTGGSKQDGSRTSMKKQDTGFNADGKKQKWGLPYHRPVELSLPSNEDLQELSDDLDKWEGDGRSIVDELLPGNEDSLDPIEELIEAQIIKWFDNPDDEDIFVAPDQMFGMEDGEIQKALELEASTLIEDLPEVEEREPSDPDAAPTLLTQDSVGRKRVYTIARDNEEIVAIMVTTMVEENDYRLGLLADGAQIVAYREDSDKLPPTFQPEHYVDESFETSYLFVDWLAVKHESHGFGRQMLGEIFRQAAETDSGVYLETTDSARAFYEKFFVNTTDDDTLFWTAEEVEEWAETVKEETEAFTSDELVEREDISEVAFGTDQPELRPVSVDDDTEPLDGGYTIGNMLWAKKPRPWKRQFRDQIEETLFMSDEDAAILDNTLPTDQRFPDERETMLQGVQRAMNNLVRKLFKKRHGEHIDQAGEEGRRGGSQAGFTHAEGSIDGGGGKDETAKEKRAREAKDASKRRERESIEDFRRRRQLLSEEQQAEIVEERRVRSELMNKITQETLAKIESGEENPIEMSIEEFAPTPWAQEGYDFDAPQSLEVDAAYYARKKIWNMEMGNAIAEGRIDPDIAKEMGFIEGPARPEDWKELPDKLWHVTTAATAVQADGLKTRAQLSMDSGTGLGGGTDMAISFTDDPDAAEFIYHAVVEARQVATGEKTVEDMLTEAREGGGGAEGPFFEEFMSNYGMSIRESQAMEAGELDLPPALQNVIDGTREKRMMLGNTLAEFQADKPSSENWRVHPDDKGFGEGGEFHRRFIRDLTSEEQQDANFDVYKTFSAYRQEAGGYENPLFFGSDPAALASVDPSEIQIMEFDGAGIGWRQSALGEWRTSGGGAVTFSTIVQPTGHRLTHTEVRADRQERIRVFNKDQISKGLPVFVESVFRAGPSPTEEEQIEQEENLPIPKGNEFFMLGGSGPGIDDDDAIVRQLAKAPDMIPEETEIHVVEGSMKGSWVVKGGNVIRQTGPGQKAEAPVPLKEFFDKIENLFSVTFLSTKFLRREENFPDMEEQLKSEQAVIENYKTSARSINRLLRGEEVEHSDDPDEVQDQIDVLDGIMRQEDSVLAQDAVLYRGMDLDDQFSRHFDDLEGEIIGFDGYTSASLNQDQPLASASTRETNGEVDNKEEPALVQILALEGTRAFNLSEQEVLLDRGLQFRVIETKTEGDLKTIVIETIPQSSANSGGRVGLAEHEAAQEEEAALQAELEGRARHDDEEEIVSEDTPQNRDVSISVETSPEEGEPDEFRRDYWIWEKGDVALLDKTDFDASQDAASRQVEAGSKNIEDEEEEEEEEETIERAVVGPLRRVVIVRHGKHIDQAGEEGKRGGSQVGFKHEEGSVGGGGSKKIVGITSAKTGKEGEKLVSDEQVFHDMREFEAGLKAIKTVKNVQVGPARGIFFNDVESSWAVSYEGDGQAESLIQQTVDEKNQEMAIIWDDAGDDDYMIDYTLRKPVTVSDLKRLDGMLKEANIPGGTWLGVENGQRVFRTASAVELGGTKEEYRSAAAILSEVMERAGYAHTTEDSNVVAKVIRRSE